LGKALKPFVYRDFGSLVSLGEYSTVGSLMGSIVGKSLFIEDYFARLMYRSLYRCTNSRYMAAARRSLGHSREASRSAPSRRSSCIECVSARI
jgi:NADH dehydrogenase FAD-containing subunit